MVASKRFLCPFSLLIIPLLLTICSIFLFGSGRNYQTITNQHQLPPLFLIHLGSVSSSFLSSLSAWLVLAGDSRCVEVLHVYIAQVALGLHWEPLMIQLGWAWLGCCYCLVHFGALVTWHEIARVTSPVAGVLVRVCLVWVALLTYLSFKIVLY